jgi:hypothetical protein
MLFPSSQVRVSASYRQVSLKILGEFPEDPVRVSLVLGRQKSQFIISIKRKVAILLGFIPFRRYA